MGLVGKLIEKIKSTSVLSDRLRQAWENLKAIADILLVPLNAIITALAAKFGIFETTVSGIFDAVLIKVVDFVLDASEWMRVMSTNWTITWTVMKLSAVAALLEVMDVMNNVGESISSLFKNLSRFVANPSLGPGFIIPEIDLFKLSPTTKAVLDGLQAALVPLLDAKKELEGGRAQRILKPAAIQAAAAAEVAGAGPPAGLLSAGRSKFSEFGAKIQDALLKGKDNLDQNRNQLLEKQVAQNDMIISAIKEQDTGVLV